jgi:hypothetical protein
MYHAQFAYSDAELLDSVRRVGVLAPTIWLAGELLDGARRMRAAEACGAPCPAFRFDAWREAAQALWDFHPDRALRLCRSHGCVGPRDTARALMVRLSAVLAVERAAPVRRERHVRPWSYARNVAAVRGYLDRVDQGIEPLDPGILRSLLETKP